MKKKNLKSLRLNKEAISSFNHLEVRGGKRLAPTKELSCEPDDCVTVTTINVDCDISIMYGSCNLSCNPLLICI